MCKILPKVMTVYKSIQLDDCVFFPCLSPHHPTIRRFKERPGKNTERGPLQPPVGPLAPQQALARLPWGRGAPPPVAQRTALLQREDQLVRATVR